MIIDFHTHVFPDKIAEKTIEFLAEKANIPAYGNGTVDSLKEVMRNSGTDYAVTLPIATKPSQTPSINNFAAGYVGDKSIIPFGTIHPEYEDWQQELNRIKDLGLKGIKFHPEYQDFFVDDEKYFPLYEHAAKLGLIMIFHAGVDLGFLGREVRCTPQRSVKVIDYLDYDKIVLAHMGASDQWEDTYNILAGKNVYFDTAFAIGRVEDERFKKLVYKHGVDKILYATDFPWHDPVTDIPYLKGMGFTEEELDCILYKNAVELLGGLR